MNDYCNTKTSGWRLTPAPTSGAQGDLCYPLLSLTFHQGRANYSVCKWPHNILLWKSCVYYHIGSECFYGYLVTKPDALLQQKYSGAIACIQMEALKDLGKAKFMRYNLFNSFVEILFYRKRPCLKHKTDWKLLEGLHCVTWCSPLMSYVCRNPEAVITSVLVCTFHKVYTTEWIHIQSLSAFGMFLE